ncbi:MAG TPA: hypothetical protein P5531_02380 [Bacteroidales bacterium]|nr:hypothetical protein [Bacteroidales bacterium]HSA43140.1 hypothetical protein [Bacteroidales bacterium]
MKQSFYFLMLLLPVFAAAQSSAGLAVGDYNKVGDFIALRAQKIIDLDVTRDNPKFLKLKLGQKEVVLSYKLTGENKGAVRQFDPLKNEWVDVFTVNCCANATRAKLMVYDGKAFKQSTDIVLFYTEIYSDTNLTQAEKKQLQIVRYLVGPSFKKYEMSLNPANKYPHKVIVSRWMIREHFGDYEDKYKEFSIEDKAVTSY